LASPWKNQLLAPLENILPTPMAQSLIRWQTFHLASWSLQAKAKGQPWINDTVALESADHRLLSVPSSVWIITSMQLSWQRSKNAL